MVVNPHLSIHDKCYGFTSCSRTSTTPSIVPEFLRSTSCKMTTARDHGAIVYCVNSGSEDGQTGRHNGEKRRERKGRTEKERGRVRDGKREEKESGREREREEPALHAEKG
ncbi:hypothetical protein TNCV_2991691 [Trichonephila clavipes]|uniref:Uncharacterized protein n=1 Tax=Trichonephila clavipes TaxID=2585209 RepID=A0A8X6SA01_TRICX|nr:hypothetical protein TNCV_2991691 [Trichonephila clavipes]